MAKLNTTGRKLKWQRLKGFTLLESVVAITILSVLIGLGSAIYTNVLKAEDPMVYHRALLDIDRCYQRLLTEQELEDKLFEYDGYYIKQEITSYKNKTTNELYKVSFSVTDNYSNKLYDEQHLMIIPTNEK